MRPQVVDLGEQYDGQINFVTINIGTDDGRPVSGRYGVRATPTFVLLDTNGEVIANAPGWPGQHAFQQAFDQLLGL
ncbi:MAG: thioredoxin family protein [Chloroflexota bacterium]